MIFVVNGFKNKKLMAVTKKQKHAVRFIIETLRIPFKGDIEEISDVHDFLSKHLDDAKLLCAQLEKIGEWNEEIERINDMWLDSRIAEQEHLW